MSIRNCQNCNVSYGPDDMFCENCGYDFITGSLPVDAGAPSAAAPASPSAPPAPPSILDEESSESPAGERSITGPETTPPAPGEAGDLAGQAPVGAGDVPRLRIVVAVDQGFFDQVVNDGEIDFPDPVPADQELALAGAELHIGRTSDSRAIHPDIDVADLTGDQAVSSRHAVLRVANDGAFTIVDVGSTNGTFLDAVDSEAIVHGVPMEVKPGVPIFVGAWTRLTILD